MIERQKQIRAAIQKLASNSARLTRATAGKTTAQLHQQPTPSEWAATEILAHIRAVDAIVAPRIYMILSREKPLLVDFDERKWAEIAGYVDQDFRQSLSLFAQRQEEVVTVLRQLPADAWCPVYGILDRER